MLVETTVWEIWA